MYDHSFRPAVLVVVFNYGYLIWDSGTGSLSLCVLNFDTLFTLALILTLLMIKPRSDKDERENQELK